MKIKSKLLPEGDLRYFARNKQLNKTRHKRNDFRFYITMGYVKFEFLKPIIDMAFCPFCGTNLYDFYVSDEYANEIEDETFTLGLRKPDNASGK
ncbi:MAG: hypothetical protein J6Y82_09855 [Bacteroidales bacterium]|nr:hypothetical protein [Bacteroidales bacterium]